MTIPSDDIDDYLCPCCELPVFITTCNFCGYTEDESKLTKGTQNANTKDSKV